MFLPKVLAFSRLQISYPPWTCSQSHNTHGANQIMWAPHLAYCWCPHSQLSPWASGMELSSQDEDELFHVSGPLLSEFLKGFLNWALIGLSFLGDCRGYALWSSNKINKTLESADASPVDLGYGPRNKFSCLQPCHRKGQLLIFSSWTFV